MWRRSTTAALPRNLLQLFRRPRGGGASSSSSLCPFALNYSSSSKAKAKATASPLSEIRDSLNRAYLRDPVFIKRRVQELVYVEDLLREDDSHGHHADYCREPDIELRQLFDYPLDEDPAATMARICLELCLNQTLTRNTRTEAFTIINSIVFFKPDSLVKYRLVNPILQSTLRFMAVRGDRPPCPLPSDPAQQVVRTMAKKFPEQVFSAVLEFASSSSQNTDPDYRVAAVAALGLIAEGCSELIKHKLEPLLGIVLGPHRDPDQEFRRVASSALHHFTKHVRPEIVSQRQSLLPAILSGLDTNDRYIRYDSYGSLQALCDSMTGEEILPFLDPIMNKLLVDLQRPSIKFAGEMGTDPFSAMCSVAAAADQHFVPYADRVLEALTTRTGAVSFLENYVFATALVKTVGARAGMEPMLSPYIEAAVLGWPGRACRDRTQAYGFFCTAAETLGDGFAKYLPDLVPRAICSCNLDEDDHDSAAETRSFHRTELLDDKLDEKAAAARALGLFAVHTKTAFAPYLEESLNVMINLSAHYHEDVRLQGVIGLRNILTAAAAVSESPSGGAAKAKQLLGTVMDRYIKAMDEDGDKSVVAQVCTDTAGILEDLGYAALEPYVPRIIYSVLRLLQGQSACQRADDAEHKETLMAAVSNLLSALAKAAATTSPFAASMCSMLSGLR